MLLTPEDYRALETQPHCQMDTKLVPKAALTEGLPLSLKNPLVLSNPSPQSVPFSEGED